MSSTGIRQDEAEALAVAGDVGQAALRELADRVVRHVGAGEVRGAACRTAQADDRLDELGLAVAGHAGDPQDLPGADLERAVLDHDAAAVVGDGQAVDGQHHVARRRGPLLDGERHLAPDHHLGEILLGGGLRIRLADHATAPDHGDPVGDREDLVELVADEDDARPLGREAAQDGEDLDGLLRGENRRGLVEDQDPGAAVERLEDLDALLDPDGQLADERARVDLEAELLGQGPDLAIGLLRVEHDRVGHRLVAEDDVLGHGEDGDQHEVLVDHPDAAGDRVGRARDADHLAVDEHFPLVGLDQPVEDVHERALAGAVLAEEGMDLAGPDIEVDVVVGEHARELLRDPAHAERRGHPRQRARAAPLPSGDWVTISVTGIPPRPLPVNDDGEAAVASPSSACTLAAGVTRSCRRPRPAS